MADRDAVALHPVTHEGMMGEEIPGGMAEYVRVPTENLIRLAPNVDFVTAGAVPIAYGTAIRMLFEIGKITASDLILILGASGGRRHRLRSARQDDRCDRHRRRRLRREMRQACRARRRPYDRLFAHRLQPRGLDAVRQEGRRRRRQLHRRRYLGAFAADPKPRGKLLTCGATAGYKTDNDMRFIWVREFQILGSNGYSKENIATALDHVAAGRVKPVISHRLPLREAREAEALMEDRRFFGKVVLEP